MTKSAKRILALFLAATLSAACALPVAASGLSSRQLESLRNRQEAVYEQIMDTDETLGYTLIELRSLENDLEGGSQDAESLEFLQELRELYSEQVEEEKQAGAYDEEKAAKLESLVSEYVGLTAQIAEAAASYTEEAYENDGIGDAPDNGSSMKIAYMAQNGGLRWKDLPFGGGNVASSGSSITSLAMVITYLSGANVSPADVWDRLEDVRGHDSYYYGNGQKWAIFTDIAGWYGLECEPISPLSVEEAIADGRPVVMACAPGEFAKNGNYVVITGRDPDGYYYVNDPAHAEKSYVRYSLNALLEEGVGWWAFSGTASGAEGVDSYGRAVDWYDADNSIGEDYERFEDYWDTLSEGGQDYSAECGSLFISVEEPEEWSEEDVMVRLWNTDSEYEEDLWLYGSAGWAASFTLEAGEYSLLAASSRDGSESFRADAETFTVREGSETGITLLEDAGLPVFISGTEGDSDGYGTTPDSGASVEVDYYGEGGLGALEELQGRHVRTGTIILVIGGGLVVWATTARARRRRRALDDDDD